MTPVLRKPILMGGLGLTAGTLLLGSLDFSPFHFHFGGIIMWGALALSSGLWWLKQQSKPALKPLMPFTPVDRTAAETALAEVEARIGKLAIELNPEQPAETAAPVVQLRQQLAQLTQGLERRTARLAITGGRSVGKTALTRLLQGESALAMGKSAAAEPAESAAAGALDAEVENADLVLFLTAGDLTDSEFQTVKQLIAKNHRILLLFNKQDQYLPDDRPVVLQRLRDRMQGLLAPEDVLPVMTQPASIKVRQHQADGTIAERLEQPQPDIAGLQQRAQQILTNEAQQLIFATVKRQAQALTVVVQTELNQVRRQRALPVIEQYQWIAAGAAFANPVPSLDLLATATINAQLVVDLGAIYQQQFSVEQAKTVIGNLASQMVKLGLVEMASQAIAPLLKSHALTYMAGGTLQGISAAYLTRLAGLSLVEYFEEQSLNPAQASSFKLDRLVQKLKAVFQENQRSAFLQSLVQQGVSRLVPQAANTATT
ncbi:DUF697 domain-containing protein [Phormidium tenue FACHB-886]|nr:DUF697 domain-containing protein [Phormidium tenue FACHB-886]